MDVIRTDCLVIGSHTDPEGANFIFVSWFTYRDETASRQRWLVPLRAILQSPG